MAIHLVVQVPFWHYERGSIISDSAEIEKAMENHGHFVTQVNASEVPVFDVPPTDVGPHN